MGVVERGVVLGLILGNSRKAIQSSYVIKAFYMLCGMQFRQIYFWWNWKN